MASLFRNLFYSPHQILPFVVGTHLSLSALSLVNSQVLPPVYKFSDSDNDIEEEEECFDAGHYILVQEFVGRMYRGKQATSEGRNHTAKGSITGYHYRSSQQNPKNQHPSIQGVQLASTATFEDPAAVCRGAEEIQEAFRALQALQPSSLSPPICINVQPQGEKILLTYALHQQYVLPWYGPLLLRSLLQVTVQLQTIPELAESEFWVLQMKELWGGRPLAWPYFLYYPSRRLNGMLSYLLTSWLL